MLCANENEIFREIEALESVKIDPLTTDVTCYAQRGVYKIRTNGQNIHKSTPQTHTRARAHSIWWVALEFLSHEFRSHDYKHFNLFDPQQLLREFIYFSEFFLLARSGALMAHKVYLTWTPVSFHFRFFLHVINVWQWNQISIVVKESFFSIDHKHQLADANLIFVCNASGRLVWFDSIRFDLWAQLTLGAFLLILIFFFFLPTWITFKNISMTTVYISFTYIRVKLL